ncbi:DUF3800 domain-containing protein [bacterium]|nr:DUF3800 domain-containing protein [bacterium]
MFFFYVDESGTLDPDCNPIVGLNGSSRSKEHLYVLTAVSLFDHRWHGFEKTINRQKRALIDLIQERTGMRLDLSDCEIKSTWVRIPKERARHRFLSQLANQELTDLCDLFYRQLAYHRMQVFCVVLDKRYLADHMDQAKIHRKAWELLLERIEEFMRIHNPSHQALLICDDVSIQANRSLALKHAYLLENGTKRDLWLKHICEMPHFVRSELCNGVQLADLVGYNFYRTFRDQNTSYPFMLKVLKYLWSPSSNQVNDPKGLYVFPGESPLRELREELGRKRAQSQIETSP